MTATRIEKQTLLNASRSRVWRALTDSKEFGSWFGMKLDGPFAAGAPMRGTIVPTTADPEIAKVQKPHEGSPVELAIERIEPERLFAFRWHPYAVEPGRDYSKEPMTLVSFTLEEQGKGVLLRVTESGFEVLPQERREEAFQAHDGGWGKQMELIAKHLARSG